MEEDLPLRVAQKQGQQAPLQAISRPHLHEGGGGGGGEKKKNTKKKHKRPKGG
jgi:hypothetical protein